MHTVNRVRKEQSNLGPHEHIAGVCTTDNKFYTRAQVVASIRAGDRWVTLSGGNPAVIREITYCPAPRCIASPYITTRPDNSNDNNLESLPGC